LDNQTHMDFVLVDGYVHQWLVAGPSARTLPEDLLRQTADAVRAALHNAAPGMEGQPCHLADAQADGETLRWQLASAAADHLVHLGDTCHRRSVVTTWAYIEVLSERTLDVEADIAVSGPVDVWCNDVAAHRSDTTPPEPYATQTIALALRGGPNRLLVRLMQLADGPCPVRLALRLPADRGLGLRLPSASASPLATQRYQKLFEAASLERTTHAAGDSLAIRWAHDLAERCAAQDIPKNTEYALRLQNAEGRIFAETMDHARPGARVGTLAAEQLVTGPYQLVMMPPLKLVAEAGVRVRRAFDVDVLSRPPVADDPKPYAERLFEGVRLAMRQAPREGVSRAAAPDRVLLSEWAAMTLDAWRFVHEERISAAIDGLARDSYRLDRALLALIGMDTRYSEHRSYPTELTHRIDALLAQLAGASLPPARAEVTQLTREAVLLLACQRLPDATFVEADQTGSEARRAVEGRLRAWLSDRGRYGLPTLADDGDALDTLAFVLTQLADLAEDTLVRELSAVLLDKVLYLTALDSFNGIGTGGTTGTTAALGRVIWGSGAHNAHLWSIVGLANARGYPVPAIIAELARDLARKRAEPTMSLVRHRAGETDGPGDLTRRTYRTPDFLVVSTSQGSEGGGSSWVATLSPEARVWTHQPAHLGTRRHASSGYWQGSAGTCQVDHQGPVVVTHYRQPAGSLVSFSHAHFPVSDFTAHTIREDWAFAQKGNAYIAIGASTPLAPMAEGVGAGRELRAYGADTTWLCVLGRAAEDGSFAAFQQSILASEKRIDAGSVRLVMPDGTELRSTLGEPLQVNGVAQRQDTAVHLRSPHTDTGFPADLVDIQIGDSILRLDYSI